MFIRDFLLLVYYIIASVYVWFTRPITDEMFMILIAVGFGCYALIAINELSRPESKLSKWMLREIIICIKPKK